MEYGLIGEKLIHSFSKEIHEKINHYQYELVQLSENQLDSFMTQKNFKAINVTIPYKEKVIPYLNEISPEVKEIKAVNVIVNQQGFLKGYNTDYLGMKEMIQHFKISLENKNVYILGNGATAKTATYVAKSLNAKTMTIVSRSKSQTTITYDELLKEANKVEIIINTTPAEMFPNQQNSLLNLELFNVLEGVIDVVYNPLHTNLTLQAKKKNIACCNGLYMLIAQAVYASSLFINQPVNSCIINRLYQQLLIEKQNLVLIGMPTCGKTTIGKQLAKQLKKQFIDSDELITQKIKMPIKEYFALYGERKFREIEHQIIKELSTKNGVVIATGGGVILNEKNIHLLKYNGHIIFLNKDLSLLQVSDSRPLSSNAKDLKDLYEKRYPLYLKASDMMINANHSCEEIVSNIMQQLEVK